MRMSETEPGRNRSPRQQGGIMDANATKVQAGGAKRSLIVGTRV